MIGRLALAFAAGMATAIVAIVWIVPIAFGPFSIDCGELSPEPCDRVRRSVAAEHVDWLPVTAIRIIEATDETGTCGSYYIERWIFQSVITYDCL